MIGQPSVDFSSGLNVMFMWRGMWLQGRHVDTENEWRFSKTDAAYCGYVSEDKLQEMTIPLSFFFSFYRCYFFDLIRLSMFFIKAALSLVWIRSKGMPKLMISGKYDMVAYGLL
ncbi:unnamed protein product [Eruca vesicaria subsp. sativa]|uniref:Uncharacterized protein n=1 Tax=Eruca vesicaria subsp. sativa TaxID=29727 RepID=A0ABC8LU26_ERUVS|nr:unnamed protein product [Eruca vesicaria subsp. sativa]